MGMVIIKLDPRRFKGVFFSHLGAAIKSNMFNITKRLSSVSNPELKKLPLDMRGCLFKSIFILLVF